MARKQKGFYFHDSEGHKHVERKSLRESRRIQSETRGRSSDAVSASDTTPADSSAHLGTATEDLTGLDDDHADTADMDVDAGSNSMREENAAYFAQEENSSESVRAAEAPSSAAPQRDSASTDRQDRMRNIFTSLGVQDTSGGFPGLVIVLSSRSDRDFEICKQLVNNSYANGSHYVIENMNKMVDAKGQVKSEELFESLRHLLP